MFVQKIRKVSGTQMVDDRFFFKVHEEEIMKRLAYAFAALATIAVATPTIANAEEFGIRVGGDRDMHRDRGFRAPSSLMVSTTVACIADGIAAIIGATIER
jgi:hypothetical protein